MNNHSDMTETFSPSLRWLITNPFFLCIEIIFIYFIINLEFSYPDDLFFGNLILLVFASIYFLLNFSPITSIQTSLIIITVLIQTVFSLNDIETSYFFFPSLLIVSQMFFGFRYFIRSKIIVNDGLLFFKSNSFSCRDISVESRIKTIGRIFGFGELIIHHNDEEFILAGVEKPIEKRRILIDNFRLKPHPQKANWSGTIVLFLVCSLILISPIFFIWIFFYSYLSELSLLSRILCSTVITLLLTILILNIRLPRVNKDPASDIMGLELVNTGMWTQIFQWNELLVVKQLFRCGWGHNNYNGHKAPIIGKKMCGKWNPIALVIMHNLMLIYQMIGVHRRKIYEHHIDAIPRTYTIPGRKFRYLQEYVSKPLNLENMPEDINVQFILLNKQLERSGLFIDDIHAGNVRINSDGKIRLVDGELYTDGEVLIKNFLVNGIDDRLDGMEKVLGCERIIRWVDHRVSVDDLLKQR